MDDIRAVQWSSQALVLIDQTVLPTSETYVTCSQVDDVVDAIIRLVVQPRRCRGWLWSGRRDVAG